MSDRKKIINVSNRLPITVGPTIKKSSGGLVAALEAVDKEAYDLRWLGWPGGEIAVADREQVGQQLAQEFGSYPVYVTAEEAAGHYEGFSNSSLWPLLHYMPSRFTYEPHWWDAYERVNRVFAQEVLEHADGEDLVWVHDYQLMLLPQLLKAEKPHLKIGFFLHTPFPSYEVFRCHPRRDELLTGMLGADLIGFHTFGYLRHFRSAVTRVLGVESNFSSIRHEAAVSALGVYPIGINAPSFKETIAGDEFKTQLNRFKTNFAGKRVVLSVERLDYTKGLPQRLDAIDLFLSRNDHAVRNGIKFIFVSVPSRENVGQYQLLREEVEAQIGRLNGKYTTLLNSPIHFIHGSVGFAELCALYALADVALVTPLIDGMNLVAKEYIAAQQEEPGVLILSEFAGAAQELFNALIVNPYDTDSVVRAIEQALAMPKEERTRRMESMAERVNKMDAGDWARTFIEDLAERPSYESRVGTADEAKARMIDALQNNQRVSLFLDYDGSLRELQTTPEAAAPNADLLNLMKRLAERPGILTTVISGRSPDDLEKFLGQFGQQFGLIAEHGARARPPGAREWEDRARGLSFDWKPDVYKMLQQHAAHTPGSFVEQKRTSLVWHYRRSDPELGEMKARQLLSDLTTALANQPLHVRQGKKIVEITPMQINKGAAVAELLTDRSGDLALVVGDDSTDESMFELGDPQVLSLKIGEGETAASYRLPNPAAFRAWLNEILNATKS